MTDPRRALPSVSALLESDSVRPLLASAPRELVVNAVRDAVAFARDRNDVPRSEGEWGTAIRDALAMRQRRSLRPVLNATGVILHTNLGRAPLPAAALDAIRDAAAGYSNLEYDLERGARGSRYVHCVGLLRELTGAEDALVVNNGAAALVLSLNTLAEGQPAIVSRGELIEIGGSFRIPDIMAKSGARLVEVGTTNRTHLVDYERAIDGAGVIVKVHRSNFAVEGFVADVSLAELAELAASREVPVLHDLGSGLLLSLERFGLTGEPVASEVVRGATVVTMSGDKLLGGPQAGIILGRRDAIHRIRTNPLTRALRVDKLTLAALEATLLLYRDPTQAFRDIPTLAMIALDAADVRARARTLAQRLSARGIRCEVIDTDASVGGGAFPTARIPSAAVAISGNAEQIDARLRAGEPPVVSRIVDGRALFDMRTLAAGIDEELAGLIERALA
ncbi:MAG TPA: L-seryl-tRNA(Sec) selenium transferase [Gemmatimonadaceae bacterium]|nr:L-seryl-tRNA(Sec) selenium transferase [Gemmatimonadaceae bacterium]